MKSIISLYWNLEAPFVLFQIHSLAYCLHGNVQSLFFSFGSFLWSLRFGVSSSLHQQPQKMIQWKTKKFLCWVNILFNILQAGLSRKHAKLLWHRVLATQKSHQQRSSHNVSSNMFWYNQIQIWSWIFHFAATGSVKH